MAMSAALRSPGTACRARRRLGATLGAVALAVGGLVALGAPAGATDFTPSPATADGDPNSLRDVIENQATTDGDIVILTAGATYVLTLGEINPAAAVTIEGNGATIQQTSGGDNLLESGFDLTLRNVTLTGGHEPDDGGAIDMNGGDLTIVNSTLVGNCAADAAGAIENEDDDTVIIASTLANNDADDDAGAVRSKRGDLLIVNSTITNNTQENFGAVDSGQVDAVDAQLTIVYSTIVDNAVDTSTPCDVGDAGVGDARVGDGDIDDDEDVGTAQFLVANIAAADSFASFGTVVALPTGGQNCEISNPGSQGYNFSDDDTCGFTNVAKGDREDAGDPGLGALADNGGPTQTMLPLATSPLVNFIPVAACGGGDALAGFAVVDDQRGIARPQDVGCEIGSVELEALVVTFTG